MLASHITNLLATAEELLDVGHRTTPWGMLPFRLRRWDCLALGMVQFRLRRRYRLAVPRLGWFFVEGFALHTLRKWARWKSLTEGYARHASLRAGPTPHAHGTASHQGRLPSADHARVGDAGRIVAGVPPHCAPVRRGATVRRPAVAGLAGSGGV